MLLFNHPPLTHILYAMIRLIYYINRRKDSRVQHVQLYTIYKLYINKNPAPNFSGTGLYICLTAL
jgi:hypothetical protein